MSDGMPTKLVSDEGIESYDDPPATAYITAPQRVVNVLTEPDAHYEPRPWSVGRTLLRIAMAVFGLVYLFSLWHGKSWPNVVGPLSVASAIALAAWTLLRRHRGNPSRLDVMVPVWPKWGWFVAGVIWIAFAGFCLNAAGFSWTHLLEAAAFGPLITLALWPYYLYFLRLWRND
jgi:hypothetical protein